MTATKKKPAQPAKRGRPKRKPGQPRKLTPDVQKTIVDALRMGAYVETAVAHAGITKETHYQWMKRAAKEVRARERHEELLEEDAEKDAASKRKTVHPNVLKQRRVRDQERAERAASEQPFVSYADAIKKALAEGELGALGTVARVARGGVVTGRVTTTDANGKTHVTEKLSRPEWTAAAWMLERRHPDRYGRLIRQEVTGANGGPVALSWVDAVKQAFNPDDNPEDDFDGT